MFTLRNSEHATISFEFWESSITLSESYQFLGEETEDGLIV